MSKNQLIKNTTIYALGDILPRLFSFTVFPILTTHLVPEDYAIINYVNTINTFLSVIGLLCLNTYYLVYYYRVGDSAEQAKLLGNLSIFVIGVNIIFTFVLYVFGNPLFTSLESDIGFFPYIVIGVATNFFNILTVLPSALYRVQERPLPLTILNILKGGLTLGLTVVLVVVYEYKALGVLYATLVVSIVFGIVFVWITLQNMTWTVDWKQLKHALIFSLPLLPGSLAYYIVSLSDRVFIEKYLSLHDLGVYSTAVTLAMVLNVVAYGGYKAFEPHFFKIYGTQYFKQQFTMIQNSFLLVILFGAMGLSIFAREFFILFAGEGYQTAYYYVPMVQMGVVFSAMTMLYSTIITARQKTKTNSIITIIGSCISIALNIKLLPIIGITAACLTSAISLGVILILSIYYAKIRIGYRPLIVFLIAVVTVWLSVYAFSIDNIWCSMMIKGLLMVMAAMAIFPILRFNPLKIMSSFRNNNL